MPLAARVLLYANLTSAKVQTPKDIFNLFTIRGTPSDDLPAAGLEPVTFWSFYQLRHCRLKYFSKIYYFLKISNIMIYTLKSVIIHLSRDNEIRYIYILTYKVRKVYYTVYTNTSYCLFWVKAKSFNHVPK